MEHILIPLGVCVVLPVLIVWIIARTRKNETDRKAEVMLKAIEAGATVDMNQFNPEKKAPKTIKQELLEKLNGACITSLMGLAFLALSLWSEFGHGLPDDLFMEDLLPVAGCVMLAVGVGLFISYFTGKKMLAAEIDAEEKNLYQK